MKLINEIQEMGFTYDHAKVALEMANGNMVNFQEGKKIFYFIL